MADEWVVIQCPKCGEKSRAEVVARAYLGGWCIGITRTKRHKAVNYQIVGRHE